MFSSARKKNRLAIEYWLLSIPFYAYFTASSAPSGLHDVERTLKKWSADPKTVAVREPADGVFQRMHYAKKLEDWEGRSRFGVGLAKAGPGSGLIGIHAVHMLSWTTQSPARRFIGVVGDVLPEPPMKWIVYKPSNNLRRLELSWPEVTLLEALKWFVDSEVDPDEAVSRLVSQELFTSAISSLYTIRRDMVAWAAETEPEPEGMDFIREGFSRGMREVLPKLPAVLQGEGKGYHRHFPVVYYDDRLISEYGKTQEATQTKATA